MSVLIKGMTMPQECCFCAMINEHGYCVATKEHHEEEDLGLWYETERPSWCPLIEVPPHGDLIDRDELARRLGITDMDCYKCAWGNHGFCSRGGDFTDACEAIEDAPTIIEKEE